MKEFCERHPQRVSRSVKNSKEINLILHLMFPAVFSFLKNGKYLSKSELENMYQKKNMNLENRKKELKSGIGASLRSSNV